MDAGAAAVMLSLRGRLETRIFLVIVIGGPWTALLVTWRGPSSSSPWAGPASAIAVLALMGLLGLLWECLYHVLQQLRWDRDWPSLFSLLAIGVEIWPLWWVSAELPAHLEHGSAGVFLLQVGSTWLVMWTFAQGPMRVVHIRWRLSGGRILCRR